MTVFRSKPSFAALAMLVVAVGVFPACKCGSKSSESAEGLGTTPGSRGRILESEAVGAPEFTPLTDSMLSVLEPLGKQCQWLRLDGSNAEKRVVATFEGACRGARVAWSRDGKRAIVWFDPETIHVETGAGGKAPVDGPVPGEADRLYLVELGTGTVKALEFPKVAGSVDEIGIARDGDIYALAQESLSETVRAAGRTLVDGTEVAWDAETEGLPALAHAYRLSSDSHWIRTETKPTTEGWDLAMGVEALDVAKSLGPRSVQILLAHFRGVPVEDKKVLARLKSLTPPAEEDESGRWVMGTAADGGNFFAWEVSGEVAYTTGLVVLDAATGPLAPAPKLGFDESNLVAIRVNGAFVLVAHNGTGTKPRLYDLRKKELVYSSDSARAAVFWPRLDGDAPANAPTLPEAKPRPTGASAPTAPMREGGGGSKRPSAADTLPRPSAPADMEEPANEGSGESTGE